MSVTAPRRRGAVAVRGPFVIGLCLVGIGWCAALIAGRADGFFSELGAWDASWYTEIARSGYGSAPDGAIRFFALFPAIAAVVDIVAPWSVAATLLMIAWISTLFGLRRLGELARVEFGVAIARRSTWCLALWPAAIALYLAYPTGLTVLSTAAALLALRQSRWGAVAGWAALAALARPTGVLLVVPIVWTLATERPRGWRPWCAVGAPAVGLMTMGAISNHIGEGRTGFSDAQAPLRGPWIDPISRTAQAVVDLAGRDVLDGLHLGGVAIAIGLTVVAWRRLPAAWAAHSTAVLVVIMSVDNWNSIERYAYDTPQLAIAAALVLADCSPRQRRLIMACAAVAAITVAALAMAGEFVP